MGQLGAPLFRYYANFSEFQDRSRRQAEQELCDTNEQLADLTVQNQGLSSAKRKLESDLTDLKVY